MRVDVINTGTELLLGRTLNTHLTYFGERLFLLGLRIERQICIPDGDDIRQALIESLPRADIILVTGGLGPTSDDITREIAAELLGRRLVVDPVQETKLKNFYASRGRPFDDGGRRQASLPEGAEHLSNHHGTAPGIYFPRTDKNPHIFLLPGPPRELYPMFQGEVVARLRAILPINEFESREWKFVGVGESEVADLLEPKLLEIGDLEIGYCAKTAEVDLRCIGSRDRLELAEQLVQAALPEELLGAGNETLERVVVSLLTDRHEWVSVAESCTGGMIAHRITNVAGASSVLKEAFVTYANESKSRLLGVDAEVLAKQGAVSEAVARQMAEGCLAVSKADHALSVTGIAGPGGGSETKPVGTVFIGLASRNSPTWVVQELYSTDRETFKLRTSQRALDLLRRRLLGHSAGRHLL